MSTEEDTELRDLVTQTLEANGCLSKIRAQLRASIFLALDEDEEIHRKQPMLNNKIKHQLETKEGCLMFGIVHEFLSFYNLDYTLSVYESESYLDTYYKYEGREQILEDLGIPNLKENTAFPLLWHLLQLTRVGKAGQQNLHIDLGHLQVGDQTKKDNLNESSGTEGSIESNQSLSNKASESSSENSNQVKQVDLNETFIATLPKLHKLLHNNSSPKSGTSTHEESNNKHFTNSLEETHKSMNGDSEQEEIDNDSSTVSDKSSLIESDVSTPILKESKSNSLDKAKLNSQKTDKLKTKSNLSSLADLPPLQLSKSNTILLPSLYSKEFKEKSNLNLKEVDKFLDIDLSSLDNYEEDFMSDSELNFTRRSTNEQSRNDSDVGASHSELNQTESKDCEVLTEAESNEAHVAEEKPNEECTKLE